MKHSKLIYVAASKVKGAGRGVFASQAIAVGSVIEACPVLELTIEDEALMKKDGVLYSYFFLWPKIPKVAIALGYGSLYNHSYNPNATYKKKINDAVVEYVAIKDIGPDEEITINYNNGNPNDKNPLWFTSAKPPKL